MTGKWVSMQGTFGHYSLGCSATGGFKASPQRTQGTQGSLVLFLLVAFLMVPRTNVAAAARATFGLVGGFWT